MNFVEKAQEYRSKLEKFINDNELPPQWFRHQDHLAFKAFSPKSYDELLEELKPMSVRITEVMLNKRRIAAAELLGQFAVDMTLPFGIPPAEVGWIELMEARLYDQRDDPAKLDHEEIYLPTGTAAVMTELKSKSLAVVGQRNHSHEWLSVLMTRDKDELKFTDKRLADIVQAELAAGQAEVVWPQ